MFQAKLQEYRLAARTEYAVVAQTIIAAIVVRAGDKPCYGSRNRVMKVLQVLREEHLMKEDFTTDSYLLDFATILERKLHGGTIDDIDRLPKCNDHLKSDCDCLCSKSVREFVRPLIRAVKHGRKADCRLCYACFRTWKCQVFTDYTEHNSESTRERYR